MPPGDEESGMSGAWGTYPGDEASGMSCSRGTHPGDEASNLRGTRGNYLGDEVSGIRGSWAPGRIDRAFLGRLAFGPGPIKALGLVGWLMELSLGLWYPQL